jgi:uncharacterized protein YwgA
MTTYDFVHLVLHAAGDRIQGRTKLQKLVYFVGALTGRLGSLGYRPHYYGPFSPEVAGAIDRLRGLGFLEQRALSGGAVDPHGFEVVRYDYALTDDGKLVAEEKAKDHPAKWEKIQEAVEKLRQAQAEDYVKLSIAAKTYFLLGEMKGVSSLSQLQQMTPRFGWKVEQQEMIEAGRLLASLGLIHLTGPQ